MGAACTYAKRGATKGKNSKTQPWSDQGKGLDLVGSPESTQGYGPPPRPLNKHGLKTEEMVVQDIDEDCIAPFWQGANSNLPMSKKHTDEVTISQLRPWMRVTIPVKVVSLGVPTKVHRQDSGVAGGGQQQPRQASKVRGKKKEQQEQSHEVEAIAVVGDNTGCINMLIVDHQIPLFQSKIEAQNAADTQPNCLFLVNVHCRLLRSKHLQLEADQWSQIKPIDMETLLASTAKSDHLKAEEAQQKLNSVVSVDTKNDVTLSVLQNNQLRENPHQQASPVQEREGSQVRGGGGNSRRPHNRSRSNHGSNANQNSGGKNQTEVSQPARSQSKRRKNNKNRRSRSNKHLRVDHPSAQSQNTPQVSLTNQRKAAQPQRRHMPSIGPMTGPPLMILDVQNIAMRFGHNKKFMCEGIQVAIDYWTSRGHRVLGLLPDYLLFREKIIQQWELLALAQQDPNAVDQEALQMTLSKLPRLAADKKYIEQLHQMPDDVDYLIDLSHQGILCGTPSQDYDDSYQIEYARSQCLKGNETFIVSNDLFRDYIAKFFKRKNQLVGDKAQVQLLVESEKVWLREHVLSYTFVMEEFQPNPDAILYSMMQHGTFMAASNQVAPIVVVPEDVVNPEELDIRAEQFKGSTGAEYSIVGSSSAPTHSCQLQVAAQGTFDDDCGEDDEYYDDEDQNESGEDKKQLPAQGQNQFVDQPIIVQEQPIPEIVFRAAFPPLGNQPRQGFVQQLTEENMQRLPESHVPSTGLPYGYYRQKGRLSQAQAEQQQ